MPARNLQELVSAVIEAATVRHGPNWSDTAIRCRRRVDGRQCKGHVCVQRLPDSIFWGCLGCGDSGDVSGWEGTDADLTEFADEDIGQRRVSLFLSSVEYDLLWSMESIRMANPRIVAASKYAKGRVVMTGSERELQSLLETIQETAASMKGAKRNALDGIAEYIEATARDVASTLNELD